MQLDIWSWNVNGLRAVLGKSFLAEVQKAAPDILCLQETKLQEHQIPDELSVLEGYTTHWSHAQKKGYSGTVTFSRTTPLKVEYGIGVDEFDSEGRVVITEYEHFILFNVYFPNGKKDDTRLDYKLRFYDRALEVMQIKRATGKMMLVTGDYNTAHKETDLANPRENEDVSGFLPIERAWLDKLTELGWVDTFRMFHPEPQRYSWWSYRAGARPRNIGWRIDYFWVDTEHRDWVADADIRDDILGSDHCPVTVRITLP